MSKKSLKVKIFLNLFETYKEVSQVAYISTTYTSESLMGGGSLYQSKNDLILHQKIPLPPFYFLKWDIKVIKILNKKISQFSRES